MTIIIWAIIGAIAFLYLHFKPITKFKATNIKFVIACGPAVWIAVGILKLGDVLD